MLRAFRPRNTAVKIPATFLEGRAEGAERYKAGTFTNPSMFIRVDRLFRFNFTQAPTLSPPMAPERVAGISDAVRRSLNARNILFPEPVEWDSPCFRASSEAGGKSSLATGCGHTSQRDTPEE
jgi:hypothetical protein